MERYDTIIVGGGVAGLATGALLAKAGHSVAVLEKGNQLGGRAYTYEDQGFVLNYGPHAMYRPHTGFLSQVLQRLGLPKIAAPYPNPRTSYFQQGERWGALGPTPIDALKTPLFPFRSRLRLLPLMSTVRFGDPNQAGRLTWGQWLERKTSDRAVQGFLLAIGTLNTYARPSSALSARFLLSHFKRNLFARDYVGYMSRGWSTMYDAFAQSIRDQGGDVITGAGVDRLLVDGERIVVAAVGDRRYAADRFVVTVPPQQAPQLAEATSPLREELDRWSGLDDVRALCIDLGFSRQLRTNETFVFDVERDLYFSLHSDVTPDLAPAGGQLLHAMAYLSPEETDDEAQHEARHQALQDGLDRYFPGWREAAVVNRPLRRAVITSARQTPNQQGSARVPLRASTVSNLYFAGDGRDLPYNLTETSLASALQVADAIEHAAPVRRKEPAAVRV